MNLEVINMIKKLVKVITLYIALILGLYFLYTPNNKSQYNTPHSATSFVYAQF